MIERLIEASIRNRFLVLILAVALSIGGVYAVFDTPIDAIPDLSENQVIVFTDWMGRSPREVEDQVTYPLSRKLQGLAGVKAVRSSSEFNFSMITIIFHDNIDFYFARQRVTEKLGQAGAYLPAGVVPYLAPDATALGQVFWYTVEVDPRGGEGARERGGEKPQATESSSRLSDSPSPPRPLSPSPAKLWALNKFYIAPQLSSAAGVADVAIVGGLPLEYQIDVRPESLRAYGVTLGELYAAVAKSNVPAGGGVIQKNNAEYIVRGVGWITSLADIESTVIKEVNGTPIFVSHVARVLLGTQFRRSVYEKDGNEVTGGVVLMRHGQNPLTVTERVKEKIQELQPGLPAGVHIVPAYDRTRLIHGAIHTLTEVMWHEMLIASLAILLILTHVRSVFVICVTLPLAVLSSFLMMWLLRRLGIIDIQANIMSLAGITISIGILVDQAIVMVENATHTLKDHFGDKPVSGDITELVIPACRTVGRPIFFSVLIMLLSFVPVFMLSGREGKLFHPLAFTKSFALIGVALISITVVPALIPTFLKGRLRGEEENAIVRSFIHIYKPLLTWALPRRNLVMWGFAVLLVLAAGMFPLQAIVGMGASENAWRTAFLVTFGSVVSLTVLCTRGFRWQVLSLATLFWIGLWAYHFPKIGVSFMPALDEGTLLDMPISVPRASVTQAADDLKARDALLRGFPEVESVIGKAGRADTPTDPAPLDMVETFVNFRPKELWPKRVLRFKQAAQQTEVVLKLLEARGFIASESRPSEPRPSGSGSNDTESNPLPHGRGSEERESLLNDTTQHALERFDEAMRELSLRRYREFEHELGPLLVRYVIDETIAQLRRAGDLPATTAVPSAATPVASAIPLRTRPTSTPDLEWRESVFLRAPALPSVRLLSGLKNRGKSVAARMAEPEHGGRQVREDGLGSSQPSQQGVVLGDVLSDQLASRFGRWLARNPALEDVQELTQAIARELQSQGAIADVAEALRIKESMPLTLWHQSLEALGTEHRTFAGEMLKAVVAQRSKLWRERVALVNYELFDQAAPAFNWYVLEELAKAARAKGLTNDAANGEEMEQFAERVLEAQLGRDVEHAARLLAVPEGTGEPPVLRKFPALRDELAPPFAKTLFLWPRQTGPKGDLVDDEMGRVLQVPGWSNIFTQPIINRIEMLSTGVRTDIGVKVFGPDLETIDNVCKQIEAALKPLNGARDAIAAPVMGKGYLQIDIKRPVAARYGISVEDIQNEIEVALAGRVVTYTVEKRERFPVRIRYSRVSREDEEAIGKLLISPGSMPSNGSASTSMNGASGGMSGNNSTSGSGNQNTATNSTRTNSDNSYLAKTTALDSAGHSATPQHALSGRSAIPLSAIADIQIVEGPAMIKSENGRLLNYVTLNVRGRDIVGFVDEAQRVVAEKVSLPEGVHIEWSGEFEHQVRAARTLRFVFPVVIVLIFVILYLTYHDLADAALMMLAVPEALSGGAFFMYFFPKIMQGWDAPPMDFSVAVWVGFIACFGMATETGIIMLVYLREAIEKRGGLEKIGSLEELRQAVIEGAVHRLRPKLLTEGVAIIAIFPMVFARGVGGEILAPMALPVLGGLLISDEVVDLFLPVRFYWVRRARWLKLHQAKIEPSVSDPKSSEWNDSAKSTDNELLNGSTR
ncbi:MAG: efflux RND transporter permease subunit [Planctomycetaceae bacterium]